jgi:hypothetical protein
MYVYLIPKGGFNDILCVIYKALEYCKKYNRILLIDTVNSHYKINFSDYFYLKNYDTITNINKIREICQSVETAYPEGIKKDLINIVNGKYKLPFPYSYHNTEFKLPDEIRNENIIVHCTCGGGDGYKLFENLEVKPIIRKICYERYNQLTKPYLCLQVRNTDYTCDYEKLYNENKNIIESYKCVYLATDDKNMINYFKSKKINVINFTTFREDKGNLHTSNINPHTKILDLMADIYIIAMSDKLISNSIGGFIKLVQKCHQNKKEIIKKFEFLEES